MALHLLLAIIASFVIAAHIFCVFIIDFDIFILAAELLIELEFIEPELMEDCARTALVVKAIADAAMTKVLMVIRKSPGTHNGAADLTHKVRLGSGSCLGVSPAPRRLNSGRPGNTG